MNSLAPNSLIESPLNSTVKVKLITPDPFPQNNPSRAMPVAFFPSFSRPHNRSYFSPIVQNSSTPFLPHFTNLIYLYIVHTKSPPPFPLSIYTHKLLYLYISLIYLSYVQCRSQFE